MYNHSGTKDDPLLVDIDSFETHLAISDDEESEQVQRREPSAIVEDKFFLGTEFEKAETFDGHLDEPNPWHPHLLRP
jgi:hypothetical protein